MWKPFGENNMNILTQMWWTFRWAVYETISTYSYYSNALDSLQANVKDIQY